MAKQKELSRVERLAAELERIRARKQAILAELRSSRVDLEDVNQALRTADIGEIRELSKRRGELQDYVTALDALLQPLNREDARLDKAIKAAILSERQAAAPRPGPRPQALTGQERTQELRRRGLDDTAIRQLLKNAG